MEVKAKMKELMEKNTMEETDMTLDKDGEHRLLDAIFNGVPEDASIYIDTVNIHFGDHMESVNFMDGGEDETEEETALPEAKEVDVSEMKEAISAVMKVPPCIVDKVFEGMKLYLESLSEIDKSLAEVTADE